MLKRPAMPKRPDGFAGEASILNLYRRLGPLFAVAAAIIAIVTWPRAFDLEAYLAAAGLVAAGQDPYAATRAAGVDEWGQGQVYVSPPFVAQVLAPFTGLSVDVVFAIWSVASLAVLGAAITLVRRDTLVARAPLVVFSFVYVWGSLWMGQVNLFALAGLLLALGSRSDRLSGLGFALAVATRALPGAFGLVLLLERRWRAIGWAAAAIGLVMLINPADWLSFLAVSREAATLPTLPVIVQTSLAPYPALWAATAIAVAFVLATTIVRPVDRPLVAGTAIGVALVLLPSNAWHHWLSFGLAPLFLFGHLRSWSRVAVLAFMVVSYLPIGVLSSAVALATLAALVVTSANSLLSERRRASQAGVNANPDTELEAERP